MMIFVKVDGHKKTIVRGFIKVNGEKKDITGWLKK